MRFRVELIPIHCPNGWPIHCANLRRECRNGCVIQIPNGSPNVSPNASETGSGTVTRTGNEIANGMPIRAAIQIGNVSEKRCDCGCELANDF